MNHTIYFNAAQNMSQIKDKSVDLVVTSPPYPMIKMWDDIIRTFVLLLIIINRERHLN